MSDSDIPTPEQVAIIEDYDRRLRDKPELSKPQQHRRLLLGWVKALMKENQGLKDQNRELLNGDN